MTSRAPSPRADAVIRYDEFGAFLPYPAATVTCADDGPLHGLRLAVKDLYDVVGYRTGGGCPLKLAESEIAGESAPAVQRFLDAGATFVGKTHTDELAWALYGMNAHFGTPINPAAPDRIPGGSSSGSAVAVAAGLADLGLGSDTGGSVRAPASFCGLWGIRPTHGRAPLAGCMALAGSYDTAGLFARDVETLRLGALALLDECDGDPASLPAPRCADDMFGRIAPDLRAELLRAADGVAPEGATVYHPFSADELYEAFKTTVARDVLRAQGAWIASCKPPLGPGVAERYAMALTVSDADERAAAEIRQAYREHIENLVADGPLLAPAVHDAPFRRDAGDDVIGSFRHDAMKLLCVAGLAGLPQVVFPAVRRDGAPVGLSLIGARGSDLAVIELAADVYRRLNRPS